MSATFAAAPLVATVAVSVATSASEHPPTPLATVPDGSSGAVTGTVRWWLRAEGLAALAVASALYAGTGRGWGVFALLFLAPDLSFAAYLAGPRVGAVAYNSLHSYVGPLAVVLLARTSGQFGLLSLAYVWAAHIGFDRFVGYGLKYPRAFGDTHLGRKGQGRTPRQ